MKAVNLISAVCENNGIGINGNLPWRLKKELGYFTEMTTRTNNCDLKNAVIMGRKTWDSVPPKFKPFSNRINVVISQNKCDFPENILSFKSVAEAVNDIQKMNNVESVWIIGGSGIYREALDKKLCNKLYITKILQKFDCDTFFPDFDVNDYELIEEPGVSTELQEENGIPYKFEVYRRK